MKRPHTLTTFSNTVSVAALMSLLTRVENFERRWNSDDPLSIEDILADSGLTEQERRELFRYLLMSEIELERADGCPVKVDTLLQRFSEFAEIVSEIAGGDGKFPQIDGYHIIRELGRGGFATVYLARDVAMDCEVAIKLARASSAENDDALREARILAQLRHPGIVRVFRAGTTEEGHPYVVSEFAGGESLRTRIRNDEPMSVYDVIKLVARAADALHYAHEHDVIHRDVKPANIILIEDDQPLLIDFGLALTAVSQRDAAIAGTPAYMSPEQICAPDSVGPQSDVFSLGVVCYELLAGRRPFAGPDAEAVLDSIQNSEPESLSKNDLPSDVCSAIERALEKDTNRRYETAGEFAHVLRSTNVAAPWRRRLRVAMSLTALMIALLIAVAWLWLRTPRQIEFRGLPEHAAVHIDGISYESARELSLVPGKYRLKVNAAGFHSASRDLNVNVAGLNETQVVSIELAPELGSLRVNSTPERAVLVDTQDGSILSSGTHSVGGYKASATAPEHFDLDLSFTIRKDRQTNLDVELQAGSVWKRKVHEAGFGLAIPDINNDGIADAAMIGFGITALSGKDGRIIERIENGAYQGVCGVRRFEHRVWLLVSSKYAVRLIELDGKESTAADVWPVIRSSNELRAVSDPLRKLGDQFLCLYKNGIIEFRNTESGQVTRKVKTPSIGTVRITNDARKLLCGPSSESQNLLTGIVGIVHLNDDGRFEELQEVSVPSEFAYASTSNGHCVSVFCVQGRQLLEMRVDGSVCSCRVPQGRIVGTTADDDLKTCIFLQTKSSFECWNARRGRLWSIGATHSSGSGIKWHSPNRVIVPFLDRWSMVDASSGNVLWSRSGIPYLAPLTTGFDPDADVVFGFRTPNLIESVTSSGEVLWRYRAPNCSPTALLSDTTGNGANDLLVTSSRSEVSVLSPPPFLWRRGDTPEIRSRPLLVQVDGQPCVVVSTDWPGSGSLKCFDGKSGVDRWQNRMIASGGMYHRSPAVADWDGDGQMDLVGVFTERRNSPTLIAAFRAADGQCIDRIRIAEKHRSDEIYAEPTVRDFNADGTLDFAVQYYAPYGILFCDGVSRKTTLFEMPGNCMGRMGYIATHRLLLSPCFDSRLHFIDVKLQSARFAAARISSPKLGDAFAANGAPKPLAEEEAKKIWCRSSPAVFQDGTTFFAALVSGAGELCIFNCNSGRLVERLSFENAGEIFGQPFVCKNQSADTMIIAPVGTGGIVAYNLSRRVVTWHIAGVNARSTPWSGRLNAHEQPVVVIATWDGNLLVYDLETGTEFCRVIVGKQTEGAPLVTDLNGDGTLDIFVANRTGGLSAIDGRFVCRCRK